jgi:hypothetical protein
VADSTSFAIWREISPRALRPDTNDSVSRACPIGHALDISFENWTSSLRIYNISWLVCSFSISVSSCDSMSWGDATRLTRCHQVLSHIRVISSELAKPARAAATPAVHVGALTPAVRSRFRHCVGRPRPLRRPARPSAWLRAARCRKPTSIAGKHGRSQRRCARTPHPRCTASDKPYTATAPTAPLESDHRDSNCGSPCEGTFVIVTFSPTQGPMHSIWLGCNGFTPSFMDDLYCPR